MMPEIKTMSYIFQQKRETKKVANNRCCPYMISNTFFHNVKLVLTVIVKDFYKSHIKVYNSLTSYKQYQLTVSKHPTKQLVQ